MRVLRLIFLLLLIIETAFVAVIISQKSSFEKQQAPGTADLSKRLFQFDSCPPPNICGPDFREDISVNGLKLTLTSPTPNAIQINQPYLLTASLSAGRETPISELPSSDVAQGGLANVKKTTTNDTLHNLLGPQYTDCVSAALFPTPPSSIVTIIPSKAIEYPLDEQNVTWSWYVTPQKAGLFILPLHIDIIGEDHCYGFPIRGPYELSSTSSSGIASFSLTVIDNTNPISRLLQSISYPEAITAALGALLASLLGWLATEAWKKFREASVRTTPTQTGKSSVKNRSKGDSIKKQNPKARRR